MKIIFLDIDGVLNVEHYIVTICDFCKKRGLDFNEEIRDRFGMIFCPLVVKKLAWIIAASDAKIVISSTWRMSGIIPMKEMWEARELPGEIFDVTPITRERDDRDFYERKERGHEIQWWLNDAKKRGLDIESYVIFDDDNDMLDEQQQFFIQTDPQYGITNKEADRAIEILCPK